MSDLREIDGSHLFAAGHAVQTPFCVFIQTDTGPVKLTCHRILRNLPEKRLVCSGVYGEQAVVVKFFLNPRRGQIHCFREERGIFALQAASISCPSLVLKGILLPRKTPVLVFQKIPSAIDFSDAWDQATTDSQRKQLLSQIVSAIALLHQAGLTHNDVHFNNFMVSGPKIFTIDGAAVDIRHQGKPLSATRSVRNLGKLFAQVNPKFDRLLSQAFKTYLEKRSWSQTQDLMDRLNQQLRRARYQREKKYLKKIYRESSAHVCRKTWHRFLVCDRRLHTNGMKQFLDNPDHFIDRGKLLKDGNSSTVALVEVDQRLLVVKRYNMKNFQHAMKRCPRPSRAWHSWKNAHQLIMRGISTPRPFAVLEKRWGPFRSKAYFITEFTPGPDVYHWFHSENRNDTATGDQIIKKFGCLMRQLQDGLIIHGDLKATNFIFSDGTIMVIDLDAMRAHRWANPVFRRKFKKDCRRLVENWKDLPEIEKKYDEMVKGLLQNKNGQL